MAALLRREFDVDVELVEGHYGEFTLLIDGDKVISGGPLGFVGVLPSTREIRVLVEARGARPVQRKDLAHRARISSDVRWTILTSLLATLLAAGLLAVIQRPRLVSLLGWTVFLALLQLPIVYASSRGRVDPCTAWLRRVLGGVGGR